MAKKTRKADRIKKELIKNIPVGQRKMITQPVTFSYLNGEMSMMQTRIQTAIMEKLQGKIKKALDLKMKSGFVGDLFDQSDFHTINEEGNEQYLTFPVAYAELGIEPSHYADVDTAARNMQSIVYEKEVNGMMRYKVAFPIVDIPALKEDGTPSGERRQNIYLHMTASTAKDLFKLIPYHQYLKDAIYLFKSNYAGRIYLLINANKELGAWRIAYEALRKILLTSWDEKKGAVVDKYPDFNDFKKRVLEPARKEIEEAKDKIDCTFEYELEYPEGKKRGKPETVIFHIHLTDLGKSMKTARLESQTDLETRNAICVLGITVTDAARLIKQCPSDKLVTLKEKAVWLKAYLHDCKQGKPGTKPIDNPRSYALTTLRNYVQELLMQQPVEEVSSNSQFIIDNSQLDSPTSNIQPQILSSEDQQLWERLVQQFVDDTDEPRKTYIKSFMQDGGITRIVHHDNYIALYAPASAAWNTFGKEDAMRLRNMILRAFSVTAVFFYNDLDKQALFPQ